MKQLQRSVRKTGQSMQSFGRSMTMGVTVPIAAAFAVGVRETMALQKATAQTSAVLRSTGKAANVSGGHITKMADSLSRLTGIDDLAIREGQNLLLTFTNIRNEAGKGNKVFDQASRSLLDMATALGKEPRDAAIMLGKALNDPVKGITALTRAGVSFTQAQKDQIKTLTETGHRMQAQKIILGELRKEFGGSAAAYGGTFAGQMGKLKEQFEEIAMSIAVLLMPALTELANFASRAMSVFNNLTDSQKRLASRIMLAAAAIGPLTFALGGLVSASASLIPALLAISWPVAGALALGAAILALTGYMMKSNGGFARFGENLKKMDKDLRYLRVAFYDLGISALEAMRGMVGGLKLVAQVVPGLSGAVNGLDASITGLEMSLINSRAKTLDHIEMSGRFRTALQNAGAAAREAAKNSDTFAESMRNARKAYDNWQPQPKRVTFEVNLKKNGFGGSLGGFVPPTPPLPGAQGRSSQGGGKNWLKEALMPLTFTSPTGVGGINVFGERRGGTVEDVLGYSALASGDAFTTNDDGSVTENTTVTSFLRARQAAAKQRISELISRRDAAIKGMPAARKALRNAYTQMAKAERAKSGKAGKKRRAQAAIDKAEKQLATLEGLRDYANSEIMSLGGQYQSDTEALEPPPTRTADTATDVDGIATDAGGTTIAPTGIDASAVFGGNIGTGRFYATGVGSGTVNITQVFSGEPNMMVAAQSAAWSFRTIMANAPGATA